MKKVIKDVLVESGIPAKEADRISAKIIKGVDLAGCAIIDKNIPLPDFLYEDGNEIRIGYHGDSPCRDDWEEFKDKLLKSGTKEK